MRIIGGTLKGRAIFPPSGFKARPTTDFAKEGLFNMLDNAYDLSTMRVLDLFSGTGSTAQAAYPTNLPPEECRRYIQWR